MSEIPPALHPFGCDCTENHLTSEDVLQAIRRLEEADERQKVTQWAWVKWLRRRRYERWADDLLDMGYWYCSRCKRNVRSDKVHDHRLCAIVSRMKAGFPFTVCFLAGTLWGSLLVRWVS